MLFSFDDEEQRKRWSNFPVAIVPRGGISLKDMNGAQRSAAMALVASALSPRGFEKVQQIMEGDEVNKTYRPGASRQIAAPARPSGNGGPPPGTVVRHHLRAVATARPGNGPIFGKDLYYISILGTPSETNPWMLQFGGHHLALNITIAGEHGILTPTLTGAQPALYTVNGKTVRPLGQESDKALALLQRARREPAEASDSELPAGRPGARSGAGRQDDSAGGSEGFRHERAPTRHAARCDLGMGGHRPRKRGRRSHGRAQRRSQRHLVRLERSQHRYARQQHHGLLPDSGPASGHRVRASAWAAIPRCTSTPCIAIRPTTTDGSSAINEDEAGVLIALLSFGVPVFAHRLDEYLQAMILSVEKGQIQASMRLIPGVAVSSAVIAAIDQTAMVLSPKPNNEPTLSGSRRSVDQRRQTCLEAGLLAVSFPESAEMKEGLGEIHIEFDADLPPAARTGHSSSRTIMNRGSRST